MLPENNDISSVLCHTKHGTFPKFSPRVQSHISSSLPSNDILKSLDTQLKDIKCSNDLNKSKSIDPMNAVDQFSLLHRRINHDDRMSSIRLPGTSRSLFQAWDYDLSLSHHTSCETTTHSSDVQNNQYYVTSDLSHLDLIPCSSDVISTLPYNSICKDHPVITSSFKQEPVQLVLPFDTIKDTIHDRLEQTTQYMSPLHDKISQKPLDQQPIVSSTRYIQHISTLNEFPTISHKLLKDANDTSSVKHTTTKDMSVLHLYPTHRTNRKRLSQQCLHKTDNIFLKTDPTIQDSFDKLSLITNACVQQSLVHDDTSKIMKPTIHSIAPKKKKVVMIDLTEQKDDVSELSTPRSFTQQHTVHDCQEQYVKVLSHPVENRTTKLCYVPLIKQDTHTVIEHPSCELIKQQYSIPIKKVQGNTTIDPSLMHQTIFDVSDQIHKRPSKTHISQLVIGVENTDSTHILKDSLSSKEMQQDTTHLSDTEINTHICSSSSSSFFKSTKRQSQQSIGAVKSYPICQSHSEFTSCYHCLPVKRSLGNKIHNRNVPYVSSKQPHKHLLQDTLFKQFLKHKKQTNQLNDRFNKGDYVNKLQSLKRQNTIITKHCPIHGMTLFGLRLKQLPQSGTAQSKHLQCIRCQNILTEFIVEGKKYGYVIRGIDCSNNFFQLNKKSHMLFKNTNSSSVSKESKKNGIQCSPPSFSQSSSATVCHHHDIFRVKVTCPKGHQFLMSEYHLRVNKWCSICLHTKEMIPIEASKIADKVFESDAQRKQKELFAEAKRQFIKMDTTIQSETDKSYPPSFPHQHRQSFCQEFYSVSRINHLDLQEATKITQEMFQRAIKDSVEYEGVTFEHALPVVQILNGGSNPWRILQIEQPQSWKTSNPTIKPFTTNSESYKMAKTSYKNLARKVHPDKNPHPKAAEVFLLLDDAWGKIKTAAAAAAAPAAAPAAAAPQ